MKTIINLICVILICAIIAALALLCTKAHAAGRLDVPSVDQQPKFRTHLYCHYETTTDEDGNTVRVRVCRDTSGQVDEQ